MLRAALLTLAIYAGFVAPAAAQDAEQAAIVARAEGVGRELYEHDQAAWRGTDALFEEMGQREAQSQLSGWVTQREGDAIVVTFVTPNETDSLYRAVYRNGALQEHAIVRAPLTPEQLRLYRARQTARTAQVRFCSNAYNSVTLPRRDSDIVDVYLMPGTTDAGAVLIGGYSRVAIGADGAINEMQEFSRSCLTLRRDGGVSAAALFFTHLQTPLPTETHVFINLTQQLPLMVSAPSGVWKIEEGQVTLELSSSP